MPSIVTSVRSCVIALILIVVGSVSVSSLGTSAQAVEPGADSFYTYSGGPALSSYAPGAVLDTRILPLSIGGLEVPITTIQVLYRTTDQLGRPSANVTTVIKPVTPAGVGAGNLISYQSFYDSLNPADGPSRVFAGAAASSGGSIATAESALLQALLAQGYTLNVPDTEGQNADFSAGTEYGLLTLDSIRAVSQATGSGITDTTRVGLMGYSGGAIATGWAAALAPSYAPDVNARLVGATEGGVLVAPAHNLRYIDGTPIWGGVEGMALIGVARAFEIDFDPYLNDYGKAMFEQMKNLAIGQVLGQYPDYRFAKLVKPQYADPNSIPEFVSTSNAINLGLAPSPTVPMQIRQGTGGEIEQTPGDQPGIGPGDGVMIAGDVRALARQYCDTTSVDYAQYEGVSHTPGITPWLAEAVPFLTARFADVPATDNCASIAPGNSLAAEVYRAPAGSGAPTGSGNAGSAPTKTRTRVRLPQVWQVRGKESTRLALSVVTKGATSQGQEAGRAVIRVDGRKLRSIRMPVQLKSGRSVRGRHVRIPKDLALGTHRIKVRFKPDDRGSYRGSKSRKITLTVVRSR